jgi:hypothetical protein
MDIYRTLHPTAAEYILPVHGTFSRIDHVFGHKTSINNFLKLEITSYIFFITME